MKTGLVQDWWWQDWDHKGNCALKHQILVLWRPNSSSRENSSLKMLLELIHSEELLVLTSGKAFSVLVYVWSCLQGQFHNCKYNLTLLLKCFLKSLVMEKLPMRLLEPDPNSRAFFMFWLICIWVCMFSDTLRNILSLNNSFPCQICYLSPKRTLDECTGVLFLV